MAWYRGTVCYSTTGERNSESSATAASHPAPGRTTCTCGRSASGGLATERHSGSVRPIAPSWSSVRNNQGEKHAKGQSGIRVSERGGHGVWPGNLRSGVHQAASRHGDVLIGPESERQPCNGNRIDAAGYDHYRISRALRPDFRSVRLGVLGALRSGSQGGRASHHHRADAADAAGAACGPVSTSDPPRKQSHSNVRTGGGEARPKVPRIVSYR